MPNNNEYAPTTREVRERFIDGFPIDTWVVARDDAGRDFDRWLAEHDRQVKAEALREHAKRLRYWTRDESQKLLRFSV
ncbi:MAG TPA: hypothetical protein PK890_11710, partial [Terrimesophilobacter sp.]|nr:hypothetical protein [Terrimesophilobacter sp.]